MIFNKNIFRTKIMVVVVFFNIALSQEPMNSDAAENVLKSIEYYYRNSTSSNTLNKADKWVKIFNLLQLIEKCKYDTKTKVNLTGDEKNHFFMGCDEAVHHMIETIKPSILLQAEEHNQFPIDSSIISILKNGDITVRDIKTFNFNARLFH